MNTNQLLQSNTHSKKSLHVLLSNDDGFSAIGIQVLAKELKNAGHTVSICAPSEERSGQSHAMTFFRPVLVKHVSEMPFNTYSVYGTPADCVAIALQSVFVNNKPDIVLSGINNGLNVGWDVNYSGTVGAATEAALMGYKSIALSLDVDKNHKPSVNGYENAAKFVAESLLDVYEQPWPEMQVLNINFPWLTEGEKPKGLKHVQSGNYCMYVASVDEMKVEKSDKFKVYMIGGHSRRNNGDELQDVTLVQNGFVTFSYLECRQRSSVLLPNFQSFLEKKLSENLHKSF